MMIFHSYVSLPEGNMKMAQEMPLLTMILPLKMLMFRSKLAQITKHYQLEMFIGKIPSSIGDKLQLRVLTIPRFMKGVAPKSKLMAKKW
jgi:hypothetical protein